MHVNMGYMPLFDVIATRLCDPKQGVACWLRSRLSSGKGLDTDADVPKSIA